MLKNIPTSNFDHYCAGYQNPDNHGSGYILGICLNTGTAPILFKLPGSEMLDQINAFDVAEATGTYLGQINMIKVSSFCGIQGLIWGLDIAQHEKLKNKKSLLLDEILRKDKKIIPVYSAEPLLDATAKLLGTKNNKRFPILPGSHVPCATKKIIKSGPSYLYCALAIGIPHDRDRDACLLMEDIGELSGKGMSDSAIEKNKHQIILNAAKSVLLVGENQGIKYDEIFVEIALTKVKKDEIGCALIAAPYLCLAKNAIPNNDNSTKTMMKMSLQEWEKETINNYLSVFKKNDRM